MAQTSPQRTRAARRAHGLKSREAILDAAEALFAERGYAGTGIAAISKASGLPASSIYWFFESKDALVAAVVERAMDRFIETLSSNLEGPPAERLERIMRHGLETFSSRMPLFMRLEIILALERGESDPALADQIHCGRDRARDLMECALAGRFADLGDDAPGLAEELAPLALSFTTGALLGHELQPGAIDFDRFTEELGIAMRAIAEHRLDQEEP